MKKDDIELPPLPGYPDWMPDELAPRILAFLKDAQIEAIKADRQRSGEPWGWTVVGAVTPSTWTFTGPDAESLAKRNAEALGEGYRAAPLYLPCAQQSGEPCATCSDNGAVGNILNAEPCPDCTTPATQSAEPVGDCPESDKWNCKYCRRLNDCPAKHLRDVQIGEKVKVTRSLPTGPKYSVEPHGNGYAIYQGRDNFHHGFNLARLTECTPEFSKRIESALNEMNRPVKAPSDDDLACLFEEVFGEHWKTGQKTYQFARLVLARYGTNAPTASEISEVIRDVTGCHDIKRGDQSLVVSLSFLFDKYRKSDPKFGEEE